MGRRLGKKLGGFKTVLLRGNVVDLAVGVVIGVAFGNGVSSVVDNLINPLIGLLGGQPDRWGWAITVAGQTIGIGAILNTLITFVLTALGVYFLVVVPVSRLRDWYSPEPKPAPTKACPECLSSIPEAARRCRECGAQLAPPSEAVAAAMRQVVGLSGEEIADHADRALPVRLTGDRQGVPRPPRLCRRRGRRRSRQQRAFGPARTAGLARKCRRMKHIRRRQSDV